VGRRNNRFADRLAYHILRILSIQAVRRSRKTTLAIGSALGWLGWRVISFSKSRMNASIENLRNLYPQADRSELETIIRRMFRHFGRFLLEMGRFPLLDKTELERLVKFEGLEHFTEAYAEGKGVVLATGHFGHFELANGALAVMGYPVWSVIRTVDNQRMDELIDSVRCSTGLGVIKKESAAREIIRHIRKGHVVTIAMDQNAGFNNIFVPFFGKLAATFVTPAVAAKRTGAKVLPVFSFRHDDTDSYSVRIYPPVETSVTGDMNADIRLAMMKISATLEEVIREAPEQWLWIHKRWKTRPDESDLKAIERDMGIINAATAGANVDAAKNA